ncbi:MAG: GrpB family protein [Porticoccus sp.]|nr:GrpB family protein [Porticoccus sp.]
MKIELEEYKPEWKQLFSRESEFLQEGIGSFLCGTIEHVGSTAVPGLASKPIIDIMFGVKDLSSSKDAIQALSEIQYCYYPYKKEIMHWFCKPSPEFRTHHLHLVPYESELWKERIKFRDILRNNPQVAENYQQLKKSLAVEFHSDREAYTNNKWPFIKKVLCNAHY